MWEWRCAARRGLAIAAGALSLAGAGCGGQPRTSAAPRPNGHTRADALSTPERGASRRPRRGGTSHRTGHGVAATRGRRLARYAAAIGAAKRAQAVSRATASYLRAHRLVDATFRVSRDGYGVDVAIPGTDLCTTAGRIAADPVFASQLRDTVGFLRTVTVHPAGGSGSLREYLARHCRRLARVYARTGSGSFTSPPLSVPRGRWIVLLGTRRGGAQVDAMRIAPARTVGTLTVTEPGVTSRTFSGLQRIRLRVRGSGNWTVAVLRPAL